MIKKCVMWEPVSTDTATFHEQESLFEEYGWNDLVRKGFIEYVDTEEEETTMISMTVNVSSLG